MSGYLYKHLWLSIKRSPLFHEKLGQTLLMGFFGLYFLLSFLGLSVIGGKLLEDHYPQYRIENIGLAFIIYTFIYSFFLRMMMQTFPNLHITPYLTLPIAKSKIANHLLVRSLFSFFTLAPIVLFIPFTLIYIRPELTGTQFYGILIFIIGFIILNHFLTFLLSKAAVFNRKWILIVFPLLGGLVLLDYKGYIILLEILISLSQILIKNPSLDLIPLLVGSGIIYSLRGDLISQYRLSEDSSAISETAKGYRFSWLDRYGKVGTLLDLEFRLILRSKRARSYLYMSGIMIIYPLLLVSDPETGFKPVLIAMALFVSGAFSLNYGLLLLSWNSLHFDLLLARVVDYKDIFTAKFFLLAGSSFIITLFAFPYVFWSLKFYLYVVCVSLYSMSIIPAIYMWIANYKSLKIDPHLGGAFSFNGFGATHWLAMLPIAVIPIILFYIGTTISGEWLGLSFIAGTGLLGLIFYKRIIALNADVFQKQKYALSESFKKQE
ncbi:MAG: hypothetical protein ACJA01_004170 [Saprospiraceae bacterium]|jgi:hypothetical protein